jgi:anti-anti-sigma regulatory factor
MEMVAGSIPELRVAMRGMIEEGVRELVVDLTDVRMVDSSGIG